ncbi:MAG: hypothetical protein KDA77_20370, partial [Planctomycetaceae bacterium]|nr:hypothetical protein [Planctomycetaceae bacterium]
TIEKVKAVYDQIGGLRAEIMDYLNALTARHEKQDVIEMEEDATRIYQEAVNLLIDYMRSNVLTYQTAEGVYVQVPVHEITNRMIEVLKERFPGEDIAAHHFASFFGVSMDGLRSYNKLEEFLGMQIIALPRNSQYVEIVSKLSEIGMMEMIVDLLETYGDEVLTGVLPAQNNYVYPLTVIVGTPEFSNGAIDPAARQQINDLIKALGYETEIWIDGLIVTGFENVQDMLSFIDRVLAIDGIEYAEADQWVEINLFDSYSSEQDNVSVNIDRLIELLSDRDEALKRAEKTLSEIGAGAVEEIQALDVPLTSESFKKLIDIFNNAKLKLVNTGNDVVAGFDQEMFDRIQNHINAIYDQIKEVRDAFIVENPVKVTAVDGTVFELNLTELEHFAAERLWDLVPDQTGEMIPQPVIGILEPVMMLSLSETLVLKSPVAEIAIDDIAPLPDPIRPIWYPFPEQFDPNDVPTGFGFQTLLIRLAE